MIRVCHSLLLSATACLSHPCPYSFQLGPAAGLGAAPRLGSLLLTITPLRWLADKVREALCSPPPPLTSFRLSFRVTETNKSSNGGAVGKEREGEREKSQRRLVISKGKTEDEMVGWHH